MALNKRKAIKVSYEPEADILSWEVNPGAIAYAEEAGNMVVHFSKKHVPVFVEVLQARQFLFRSNRLLKRHRPVRARARISA